MNLIRAEKKDYERITDYYKYVVENTETMPYYCRWIYGIHPNDQLIKRYIDNGDMYYSEKDSEIAAAVVITELEEGEYCEVNWGYDFSKDEVAIIHIICINPKFQRMGLARKTLAAAEKIAKEAGKKAVRLDTLQTNIVAQHLYETSGYIKRDVKCWYASNIGTDYFVLYEKLI